MIWKKLKQRGEGEVEPALASLFFPRASWSGNGEGGWACCWMPAPLPCLSPIPSCSSYLHGAHTSVAAHFLSGSWNLFHRLCLFLLPSWESAWNLSTTQKLLVAEEFNQGWKILQRFTLASLLRRQLAFQRLAGSAYDKSPRKGNIWLVSICGSVFKCLAQRLWVSVYKVESMAIPKWKRIFRKKQRFCGNSMLLHPTFLTSEYSV